MGDQQDPASSCRRADLPPQRIQYHRLEAALDDQKRDPDIGPAMLGELIDQYYQVHLRHLEAYEPTFGDESRASMLHAFDQARDRYPTRPDLLGQELVDYATLQLIRRQAQEETWTDPGTLVIRDRLLDELEAELDHLGLSVRARAPARPARRRRNPDEALPRAGLEMLARWIDQAHELRAGSALVACLVFRPEVPVERTLNIHQIVSRSGLRATSQAVGFAVYAGTVARWLEMHHLFQGDSPQVFRMPDAPTGLQNDQWQTALVLYQEAVLYGDPSSPLCDPVNAVRAALTL